MNRMFKRILYVLLYLPAAISYFIVYYIMFKDKSAGVFMDEVTKDRISQCISVAMTSSLMILVITLICTFIKKIGLPKSMLFHVFIVFSMWFFYFTFDPAVGWFAD